MSALDNLNKEAERQKRKISEIEKSIEIVEKEFDIKFEDEREDIKEQKDFINEPDLQIAIVGAIKAGKSTFINALFQENIASTEVTPETASLTKFKHSDKNKLKVKFYDKEEWDKLWNSIEKSENKQKTNIFKEEFESLKAKDYENQYIGKQDETIEVSDIEELKRKVKDYTSKQSAIHYFVKELTVYLDNDNIPKEVTIVDTPGLDDVVEYRSNITKDYIKRANAVIVCVNSLTLRNEEFKTINGVFDNVGDDLYKVIILGTQIDNFNSPKEDWEKQSIEWKKWLKDSYKKEENLLNKNIIGVSSYVESNVINLENGIECNEEALMSIYKLGKSYGIELSMQDPNLKNNIIKKSMQIRDLTNIERVNSLMKKDIISKGTEEVIKDMEKRYSNMITNISNKAKSIYESNSESRATLDMDRKQQEEFKLMKNKEIEEIETAMNGLNDAFEKIKTQWLNENKKLKEAINK